MFPPARPSMERKVPHNSELMDTARMPIPTWQIVLPTRALLGFPTLSLISNLALFGRQMRFVIAQLLVILMIW